MERTQERDSGLVESAPHYRNENTKEILVTPAAIVYVVSLILGGLGMLSFFVFPHTPAVVATCLIGVLIAAGGAFFTVRSVVRGLRA